jgi:hypothetical protein
MSRRLLLSIATPTNRGLSLAYVQSLLACRTELPKMGIPHSVSFLEGNSLISHARAVMVGRFLASDATHLLMVDDDIRFDPITIRRMLDCDVDFIGGCAPCRTIASTTSVEARFAVTMEPTSGVVKGAIRVRHVGTGFLLCRRVVFERLYDAHEDLLFSSDREGLCAAIFNPMVRDGRHLAEDYALCERWRDLGGEVWGFLDADFGHCGAIEVPGNLQKTINARRANGGA